MLRPVLLTLLLLATALPAAAQARVAPGILQPGDRLELVIWRNPELTGTYTIATDSTLLHPLFSTVKIGGVPIEEARARMYEYLREYQADPQFVFEPHYRVFVGGHVAQQGQYHFPATTVDQAITLAGGATTPNPDLRVRLIRNGEPTVANLDGSSERELLMTPIQSGDQILIEDRPSIMRNWVSPTLQVLQTVTALVATYVYFDAIFGSE